MFRALFTIAALSGVLVAQPHLAQAAQAKSGDRTAVKPAAMVNINPASVTELQTLPGIGATTAARIVEYRQKNGPFKKIEELMNVRGIGEKSFLKLKPQLTVATARAERSAQSQ